MTAYWKIRARLLRVPGVANVPIWGERLEMLQVQVDPERLREARRDARGGHERRPPTRSTRACCSISEGNFIGPAAVIDTPNGAPRSPSRAADRRRAEDLANIPIETGERQDDPPRATSPTSKRDHQLLHRRRRHQRRPRADAHRREAAMGEHARRHARGRGGARGAEAGPPRHRRSTPTIFRPATFIEDSIDNLDRRRS